MDASCFKAMSTSSFPLVPPLDRQDRHCIQSSKPHRFLALRSNTHFTCTIVSRRCSNEHSRIKICRDSETSSASTLVVHSTLVQLSSRLCFYWQEVRSLLHASLLLAKPCAPCDDASLHQGHLELQYQHQPVRTTSNSPIITFGALWPGSVASLPRLLPLPRR